MRGWKSVFTVALVAAILCCCLDKITATRNDSEDEMRAAKNLALHASALEREPSTPELTEQDKIDGIKSAFLKLPSDELFRLGVDMHHDYVAGTAEAEELQAAWTERQKELKEIMEKQLKAADYMGTIAGHLVNSSVSNEGVAVYLEELEQLLADIDNARDFHSIGGWPALTSLLPGAGGPQESLQDPLRSLEVQIKAAHCIGTAVKNDYDSQLWVLEPAGGRDGGQTVLELLLSALHNTSQRITRGTSEAQEESLDELQRRILYALSAAIRGNLDVQAAVSAPPSSDDVGMEGRARPSFESLLRYCVEAPALSVGVKRKCWHIVSDSLDEMVYIQHDVAQEYAALQQQAQIVDEEGQTTSASSVLPKDIRAIVESLHPLGMIFLTSDHHWVVLAAEVAAEIASTCTLGEGAAPTTVTTSVGQSCATRTSPPVRDIFAHVVKIKAILRKEFGPGNAMENGSDQLKKLEAVEKRYGADVEAFLNHPLMQDELY